MSVQRFMRTPAVVIWPGGPTGQTDDMGDPITKPETEVPVRCRIVAQRALEERDGGAVSIETLRAFLPADLDPVPTASCSLRARGVTYTLDGPAQLVESPRSNRPAYLVANLRAVT